MLTLRTNRVKIGDVLATTIFSSTGSIWMTAGTVINSEARKQQLMDKGVAFVEIKNSPLDDALPNNVDSLRSEYARATEDAKAGLYTIKSKQNSIDLNKIMDSSSRLVENFFASNKIFYKSDEKKGKTLDIYDKAIIVAQYSLTLARIVEDYRNKNYIDVKNEMQLRDFYSTVSVTALMHEMGELCKDDEKIMSVAKSGINQKVLARVAEKRMIAALANDNSRRAMIDNGIDVNNLDDLYKKFYMLAQNKLEKYDEMYMPLYTFGIVKASEGTLAKALPNLSIAEAAILHQKDNNNHSNAFIDIPYKDKNGNDTDTSVISKIVKIASSYDKLTREAAKEGKLVKPEEIISYMENQVGEYDDKFLGMFKRNIPPYDIGDIVVMDNGLEGIVVDLKADAPQRPTVAVENSDYVANQTGNKFIEIDLRKDNKTVILGKKIIDSNDEKER